jgi:23S rRNA (adenine2503-C2)-methyltransferase
MERFDLKDMTLAQLAEFVQALNLPSFRAGQIFSWLYRPGIVAFEQMTDIKKELRASLTEQASISRLEPTVIERSKDGTIKYGFPLADGAFIETVLIPEAGRNTLCVSSQVGCAMGCEFCLTGKMGLTRNLRPSEMVNQVAAVIEHQLAAGTRDDLPEKIISNLVFMGMGEPLANFDNLLTALSILTEQRGLDFSERRITVSTCGLVPKIYELGKRTRVNLAVSLHSVDDELRSRLMPINRTYPLAALLQACREFPLPKRKRIMFEYILIKDLNDAVADAELLVNKLRDIPCKINLLPYNKSTPLPFQRPPDDRIEAFQKILWNNGYTVLLRNSRGGDISAACGQLAGKNSKDQAASKPATS